MSDEVESVQAMLRRWPETAHLAARLKVVRFRVNRGHGEVVEEGVETGSLIDAMRELMAITDTMEHPPAELLALAARVRRRLPSVEAFHNDPHSVMANGVN